MSGETKYVFLNHENLNLNAKLVTEDWGIILKLKNATNCDFS